jgi:hypothetical protein
MTELRELTKCKKKKKEEKKDHEQDTSHNEWKGNITIILKWKTALPLPLKKTYWALLARWATHSRSQGASLYHIA